MSARGSRFFLAGSMGMIVVGLIHVLSLVAPPRPGSEVARAAMQAFSVTALGLTWSIQDAYHALSLSYSALSILVGAIGLVVLRTLRPDARALRALALVFALGAGALAAIAGAYGVAPPLYLYGLVTALFAVAGLRARSS